MNKRGILLLAFLFLPFSAFAAPEITLTSGSTRVFQGSSVTIQVSSSEKATVTAPDVTGNYSLSYTGEGSYTTLSIVNGQYSQTKAYNYSFVFLSDEPGNYSIGPFTVEVDGESYETTTVDIEVLEGQATGGSGGGSWWDPWNYFGGSYMPNVYLQLTSYPPHPKVNQAVIVEVEAVSDAYEALTGDFSEQSELATDVSIIYDISDKLDDSTVKTNINRGQTNFSRVVKTYVMYALDAGEVYINPPVLDTDSPYGQLTFSGYSYSFRVRPLSSGIGLSYVGDLSVDYSLSTNVVEVGKAVELSLNFEGDGNLKIFTDPYGEVSFDGLYLASPSSERSFLKRDESSNIIFSQSVSYTILAREEGSYTLPALILDYYSINGAKSSLQIPAMEIEVLARGSILLDQLDFELREKDEWDDFEFLLFDVRIWVLLLLSVLLPFFSLVIGRHRRRMFEDEEYRRQKKAGSNLSSYLSASQKALKQGNLKEFYLGISKGLFYFIADHFSLSRGMKMDEIRMALSAKVSEEWLNHFVDLYRRAQSASFSGEGSQESPKEFLKEANALIQKIK